MDALKFEILDVLVDSDINLVNLINIIKYYEINCDNDNVKSILKELLKNNCIKIAYPKDAVIDDFIFANDDQVDDYWFSITNDGKEKWEELKKMYSNQNETK